jgi:hypothetical protein
MICNPPNAKKNTNSSNYKCGKQKQTPPDSDSAIISQFITAPITKSTTGGICFMTFWAVHYADILTGMRNRLFFASIFNETRFKKTLKITFNSTTLIW